MLDTNYYVGLMQQSNIGSQFMLVATVKCAIKKSVLSKCFLFSTGEIADNTRVITCLNNLEIFLLFSF